MRLLFVSGTPTGGAARSTRQLARRLVGRGHDVALLVRQRRRPREDLVAPYPGTLTRRAVRKSGRAWREVQSRVTRRPRRCGEDRGVQEWVSAVPGLALPWLCEAFRPDVVVLNSVDPDGWAASHDFLSATDVPLVLYVREEATLRSLPIRELRPDHIVTNTGAHTKRLAALGLEADTIPSLVELEECQVESTREAVLFVNPVTSRGLDLAVALAARRTDVRFAFQTSWPLRARDRRALHRAVERVPNVELRPYEEDPRRVYRDARLLLLPYRVDNRPRVAAEAQWNGVPVLAADFPALREAAGPGGLFVHPDAAMAAWEEGLASLWDDSVVYERLRAESAQHARRRDQDPGEITTRFEAAMEQVIDRRSIATAG